MLSEKFINSKRRKIMDQYDNNEITLSEASKKMARTEKLGSVIFYLIGTLATGIAINKFIKSGESNSYSKSYKIMSNSIKEFETENNKEEESK